MFLSSKPSSIVTDNQEKRATCMQTINLHDFFMTTIFIVNILWIRVPARRHELNGKILTTILVPFAQFPKGTGEPRIRTKRMTKWSHLLPLEHGRKVPLQKHLDVFRGHAAIGRPSSSFPCSQWCWWWSSLIRGLPRASFRRPPPRQTSGCSDETFFLVFDVVRG